MPVEMIDKTDRISRGDKPTISARKAAEELGLSKAVLFSAIDGKIIIPQAIIQDEPDDKPAYGFHTDYLRDVLKALPKDRLVTQKVFTSNVKAKIEAINERWKKRTRINWMKD